MKRYNPKEIENKWQKIWADTKLYEVTEDPNREKIYATPMLPYPSGAGLHVGHVRNYSIADAVARFCRQQGYNVMSNIGWDSFGLPAENYAIKTGTPPWISTQQNIKNFKNQLLRLGISYAWDREIDTSDPAYYRWTQWVFAQLFNKDLAYQAESAQWWCPVDQTVLANEQVENGKCWRCGSDVEKKSLNQWFFKITDYADRLLEGIDTLDWPENIKAMQRNWIGRSEGASIQFKMTGLGSDDEHLEVFTTAHDTIYGATFMVIAPEHPFVQMYGQLAENWLEIDEYVTKAIRKSELDREIEKHKTGVEIQGLFAINPINDKKIPVWIADYVLVSYGSGAIMAVPGEDERDFEFAQKYKLPVIYTTEQQEFINYQTELKLNRKNYKLANSEEFNGLDFETGREKILQKLVEKGAAEAIVQYKIRDWLISRQRYWGAPIPIIHCAEHGAVAVPEDQLPVVLPEVENFAPSGDGQSVLATVEDWVNAPCPVCGQPAKRETDTMDGYACSSWYMLRYTDPQNDQHAWTPDKANYWFPIDYYFGADHAVSHLLYFRFWNYFFADQGWIDRDKKEPVKRLVYNGYIFAEDGAKMSKSKGNVVDPLEVIDSGYGADALRLFELFIGPYDQAASWSPKGVAGTFRFLQRVWTITQEFLQMHEGKDVESDKQKEAKKRLEKNMAIATKKVTKDLRDMGFNTAIAALMECVNELYKIKASHDLCRSEPWRRALANLLQLLAPFAPHITEELWHQLGEEGSIHLAKWPEWDKKQLQADTINIVIQVNGKVRATIEVPAGSSEGDVTEAAQANERVNAHLEGKPVIKVIYVPGKLINFVK